MMLAVDAGIIFCYHTNDFYDKSSKMQNVAVSNILEIDVKIETVSIHNGFGIDLIKII